VEKNEFSLKTLKWTYGLETRRTVRSITAERTAPELGHTIQSVTDELYFHQLSHSSYFRILVVALIEIELIISLFSVFDVMKPQEKLHEGVLRS
jgi:hypothetical protein